MEKGIDSYLKEQFEIPDVDIRTYSPLTLAYIGDGIYDLVIRSLVVAKGNTRASELHKRTSQIVKAHTQAEMMEVLLPILTAIVYGEWNTLRVFAGSALFCIVTGALLRGKKPENTTIFSVEGYVSVALCWVALSICGAIPLCVSGVLQNPFDAFFEIVSGFTTTGSSVM